MGQEGAAGAGWLSSPPWGHTHSPVAACLPSCHTQPGVPAAQDHHRSGQAGLSSSAALQPQRDARASGYHQRLDAWKVTRRHPSTSQGGPWFYLLLLLSARAQAPLPMAPGEPRRLLLQFLGWLGQRVVVRKEQA